MKTLSLHISIPFLPTNTKVRSIVLAFVGSIVIAGFAQIAISLPFSPVPITGQTFAVLLVGMTLGARTGALSLLLYLIKGAVGFPVFAEFTGGFRILLGPTGGYLFGFVLAAYVVGFLAQKGWDRSLHKTFITMMIGNVIVFTCGLLQLGFLLGGNNPIFAWGLFPFIPGAIIKTGLASLLLPLVWKKIHS